MAKVTNKTLDEGMQEIRKITGINNLLLSVATREYGIRMLGAPIAPGVHQGAWLSPRFETREELVNWMHGFLQGWTLCSER